MQKKSSTYRQGAALLLILVFTAAGLLRATHGLLAHRDEHRHDRPVCAATHDGATHHLHDERYATNDCPVCDFWFATPEVLSVTALLLPPIALIDSVAPVFESSGIRIVTDTTLRRGPPVL